MNQYNVEKLLRKMISNNLIYKNSFDKMIIQKQRKKLLFHTEIHEGLISFI